MRVHFTANTKAPDNKLADAELIFEDTDDLLLSGLRLIGFAVWAARLGSGRNVTFPARQYSVNGERRSFALLRPISDPEAHNRLRDFILRQYELFAFEQRGKA